MRGVEALWSVLEEDADELPAAVEAELGADLVVYERHAKRVTFWMGGCFEHDHGVLGRTRIQVRRQLSEHVETEHAGKTRTYVEKRRYRP